LSESPRCGTGDVSGAVTDQRQAAVIAVVVRVAVDIVRVEQQGRLNRVVVIRFGEADASRNRERIIEGMFALQADLRELGRKLVVTSLGPDVHVVEYAVYQRVGVVDRGVDDIHVVHGCGAGGAEYGRLEKHLVALGVETRNRERQE
jgi:hypothetical protein